MMGEKHNGEIWLQRIPGLVFIIAIFAISYIAGYYLIYLLFSIVGWNTGVIFHLISCIIGFFVFFSIWRFGGWNLFIKTMGNNRFEEHNKFSSKMIETIEKIARGDFKVLIPIDTRHPFSEIAESINQMAQNLGTMESLRQDFISNVSHEIQSPLTSISGFAALLKNETLTKEQRIHYIEIIETESNRLSKLSDNLLKLSSLENNVLSITKTEISLDKQLQNAVLTMEPHWVNKNLDLSADLEKIKFYGDSDLLVQVWINLIHNAIKFTPENGEIQIQLTQTADEIICRISDTGIGFSKEDQLHLFERFYKADKSRDRALGGNGLGLSLVKSIVELHDGKILADSVPGKGSSFTVILPKEK